MYDPTVADRVLGSAAIRRRQATARALARTLSHLDVEGLANIPARGPVVLVMNHRAFVDGPVVFGFVRRPVTCLVKSEAFTPGLTPILRGAGQIPVRRDGRDYAAVRLCLRVLRGGGVVGVFPEGSRGNGLVETSRPGAAYLAMRTGAVIVPVAFHGTDEVGHGVRPRVQLVIGAPITVPVAEPGTRLNRRAVAAEAERVRAVHAALVAGSTPQGRSVAA